MKISSLLGIGLALGALPAAAVSLDDIQFWAGSGTNRAAMVIQWESPEVLNNTSVPRPVTDKSLVWGFRWNGAANGEDMFNAILAADPRLFAVVTTNSTYGKFALGFGYDLDNNRVTGIRNGTNIIASAAFTHGWTLGDYGTADFFQSLDPVDLYWGGGSGPGWELWHEQGNTGGYTNEPQRGASPYWTPGDPTAPYFGDDGQWHYSDSGMNGLSLKDGSWLGWTISPGGLDFLNPDAPGTIAWGLHKHAPSNSTPVPALASPFASGVVAAQGPFGAAPYDDPASALGMPSTDFYDSFGSFSGNTMTRRVKIVEPPYNLDPTQTKKLITTLNDKSFILVQFDQPIYDNPANPYGIDFLVFGNTLDSALGAVNDEANMNPDARQRGFHGTDQSFS
jgi:hypothetical protein